MVLDRVREVRVMKKLIIAALISLLFSGCVSIGRQKVTVAQPLMTPAQLQSLVAAQLSKFSNSLVDTVYLQKSTTTANVIAVVSISGEITEGDDGDESMLEDVKLMLQVARDDFRVKAIILKVESPGGGINASNLIWNEVMKFKKSGKPIVAFFNGIAASGGYYVSVPADKIVATPETWTGSIGVIMHGLNYYGLMEMLGIKDVTIKSGDRKDMLSSYKPSDEEDVRIAQVLIDLAYERFVQKVAQGRHMDSSIVRILADGRIYDAQQALDHKLIDQIGYIEDSFELAKNLANVSDVSLIHLKKKKKPVAFNLFGGEFNSRPLIDIKQLLPLRSPGLYYLWRAN